MIADTEFIAMLRRSLPSGSDGVEPEVPLFYRTDGTIDREKTLALPCYMGISNA